MDVRFNTAAAGTSQDEHGVTLNVKTPDGSENLNGRYLIAADGASSVIRVSQGIEFPGLTFPELWLCVSTEFKFEDHFENLAPVSYCAADGFWFLLLRVPGMWRVLQPSHKGQTAEALVADDSVQDLMHRVLPIPGDYETIHRTAYSVHQRVADSYQNGRIFLAGDAAHLNNPLGGMGMNGGVHDGLNISEKIAKVWKGEAVEKELDLYETQRRPVALDYVQKTTLGNKAMLEENDPAVRKARQDDLSATAADPEKAREFLLRSSMMASLDSEATGE